MSKTLEYNGTLLLVITIKWEIVKFDGQAWNLVFKLIVLHFWTPLLCPQPLLKKYSDYETLKKVTPYSPSLHSGLSGPIALPLRFPAINVLKTVEYPKYYIHIYINMKYILEFSCVPMSVCLSSCLFTFLKVSNYKCSNQFSIPQVLYLFGILRTCT